MRLLRHVAAIYAGVIGMVLGVLVAFLTTLSLVERTGHFLLQPGGLMLASRLAMVGAVELLPEFLPVAALIALVIVGTQLARRGELLALEALGLRPRQIALPFVGVACLWASIGSVWADFAVPPAMTHKGRLAGRHAPQVDALGRQRLTHSWLRRGNWMLYLPHAEPSHHAFIAPTLFRLSHGHLVEMIEAQSLVYENQGWHLTEATTHKVAHARTQHQASRHVNLEGRWEDLYDVAGNPRHMRARHARALVKRRQNSGLDTTQQRVELFERFAQPWAAPLWVIISAPYALSSNRQRTLSQTLAWSALAVGVLLAFAQLLRLSALSARLPIFLGGGAMIWVALVGICANAALYRRGFKL